MTITSYEFQGFNFEVTVEEENGSFFGYWKCQCGINGSSNKPCTDKESAILSAKSNAASHKGSVHKWYPWHNKSLKTDHQGRFILVKVFIYRCHSVAAQFRRYISKLNLNL